MTEEFKFTPVSAEDIEVDDYIRAVHKNDKDIVEGVVTDTLMPNITTRQFFLPSSRWDYYKRVKPWALPTEPGFYVTGDQEDVFQSNDYVLLYLNVKGEWSILENEFARPSFKRDSLLDVLTNAEKGEWNITRVGLVPNN